MKFRASLPAVLPLPAREGRGEGGNVVKPKTSQSQVPPAPKGKGGRSANADRKRQQHIAEAEARIASLEAKLKALTEAMQKTKGTAEVSSLGIEYALAQHELDEALKQWEQVAE